MTRFGHLATPRSQSPCRQVVAIECSPGRPTHRQSCQVLYQMIIKNVNVRLYKNSIYELEF
jgi:hypothetical protein